RLRIEVSGRACPSRSHPFHSHAVQKLNASADSTRVMPTLMTPDEPQTGHFDEGYIMGAMPYSSADRPSPVHSHQSSFFSCPSGLVPDHPTGGSPRGNPILSSIGAPEGPPVPCGAGG